MKYYTGNRTGDTPGNLPDPYFWWECGAMFGTIVDYTALTGDTSYVESTTQALLHQAGPLRNFLPDNQSSTEGNDDQGFWAMAVMSAAENNFPNPPADQPQWLALAQGVFNQYVSRWDPQTCGGGLRWQIFRVNNGFNYKNSISNGCFFNLAARLGRFTGNQTFFEWANRVWDWQQQMRLITDDWRVLDGAHIKDGSNQCDKPNQIQWSYNAGIFLHGASVMYNATGGNPLWKTRLDGLLGQTLNNFYKNGIMYEQPCEEVNLCNIDQQSFKGYLTRWLAGVTQMAPQTFNTIMPLLRNSATAAAKACTGSPASGFSGVPGTACGFKWTTGGFDGLVGVGEQMNALGAIMYTLVSRVAAPFTAENGGTSKGDNNAGQEQAPVVKIEYRPITVGDRVAAGFLTTAIALSVIGGGIFVVK